MKKGPGKRSPPLRFELVFLFSPRVSLFYSPSREKERTVNFQSRVSVITSTQRWRAWMEQRWLRGGAPGAAADLRARILPELVIDCQPFQVIAVSNRLFLRDYTVFTGSHLHPLQSLIR